ncbi:Wadjet anti-phage system protein JetD domain-containing protein [Pseudactinotalea sp. Z1748]|uniref:Wadjet anti-phage system protein JetD domain-containing protein n=1 Tax=Pseudactinotalea sp. Z1748 TaxID=3413027 RepID=UPI003C7BD63D
MITLAAARDRARRRYERHHITWALRAASAAAAPPGPGPHEPVVHESAPEPLLSVPLHPPTESAALGDPAEAAGWVSSWREAELPGVVWQRRRWASLGTQEVPVRLQVSDPAQVAAIAERASHWRTVSARVADLLGQWSARTPDAGAALHRAVRGHAAALTALPAPDYERLRAVLAWLVDHPESGAYIRQLPVRGVDTKWTQNHRGLVTGLHQAITGRADLGLASMPDLVRVRFLDPSLAPAGLTDLSATVNELDALRVDPAAVLVVENLETLVALPSLAGVVVVLGSGHAVDRLPAIGWLRRARLLYWGDLDSHGFAILDRFRAHCAHVASVLMDTETLQGHRDLWVPEPRPTRAELTRLTEDEASALAMVRAEGDVRLEQERLDLVAAVTRLRHALSAG